MNERVPALLRRPDELPDRILRQTQDVDSDLQAPQNPSNESASFSLTGPRQGIDLAGC